MKLQLMACEVGLPVALALQEVRENVTAELRKAYPWEVKAAGESRILLSSRDGNWTVWLSSTAVGLETRSFRNFGEFRRRLFGVIGSLAPLIQGVYPRVGLRSVRALPEGGRAFHASKASSLGLVVRHVIYGLLPPASYRVIETLDPERSAVSFLDIDVFVQEVEAAELAACLEDIYRAGRRLAPDAEGSPEPSEITAGRDVSAPWIPAVPTTVAGYTDLLPPGEVDALAAERADLLRRRFLGGPLPEHDEGRLAAVTARLDELLPSVTAEDFEELEKIALRAQEISRRTTRRQKELGQGGPTALDE